MKLPLLTLCLGFQCSISLAQNPSPVPVDYKPAEFVLKVEAGGPSSAVNAIAFSPDGRELVAVGNDKTIRIWDVSAVEATQLLDAPRILNLFNGNGIEGQLSSVRYSPDGKILAVGSNFGTCLVDVTTGDVLTFLQPQPYVTDLTARLAFSPDGQYLATGHTVNVRVYKLKKFWDAYGKKTLSTSEERVKLAAELQRDSVSPDYRPGETFGLEFLTQPGKPLRLVVSTLKQPAVLFEQQSDQWKQIAKMKSLNQPIMASVKPDQKSIFLTGQHTDIESWTEPFEKPTVFARSKDSLELFPPTVIVSPDSRYVLLAPFNDQFCMKCCVYDMKNRKEVSSFNSHTNSVTAAAYHPTADLVATAGGNSQEIFLWRPSNGKVIAKVESLGRACNSVAFSSDGKQLLFGTRSKTLSDLTEAERKQLTATSKLNDQGVLLGSLGGPFVLRPLSNSLNLDSLSVASLPEAKLSEERNIQRGALKLREWSIDRFRDRQVTEQGNNILLIMKNGQEVQRIDREIYTERVNAGALVEIGDKKQMAVVVASRTMLTLHDAETGKMLRRFAGHEGEIMAVATSPDGTLLASASQDQTVRLWSLQNPGLQRRQVGVQLAEDGHSNVVDKALEGMPGALAGVQAGDIIDQVDGQVIHNSSDLIQAVNSQPAGADLEFKMRRSGKPLVLRIKPRQVVVEDVVKPILTLFAARNGQWVAWTETGHYASSPAGDSLFGILVNRGHPHAKVPEVAADFHRAKSFQTVLYRPELVQQHLAAKGKPSDEIKQVSIKQLLESSSIVVKIESPKADAVTQEERVEVAAEIRHPETTSISDVQVTVNGRLNQLVARKVRNLNSVFKQSVELSPGLNVISVQAVTASGVLSEPATVRLNFNRPIEPRLGVLYVLAIGVSNYSDKSLKLQFADKDAQNFASALLKQKGTQFKDVQITVMTNEKATRDAVRDELKRLRSLSLGKHDQVVLFLSGHGGQDSSGAYCYLTADAQPERLRDTALAWTELRDAVTASDRQAYIFLDTCHAGGAAGQTMPAAAAKEAYNKVLRAAATDVSGVITVASCLPDEESYEKEEWGNGAFTKAIIEALNGAADVNSNGLLTIAELELYVSSRVEQLTNREQSSCVFKAISVPSNLQIAVTQK